MWHGFDIGFIHISSFGLMMFLAFLSCNLVIRKTLKEKSINPIIGDDIIFWAAVGGIVGAKLYSILEYGSDSFFDGLSYLLKGEFSLAIENLGSGLVFYGGLIGGLIAVSLYIYKKGLSWIEYADIVAPLLALGHAIGRIGCLLVGDDYGIPTEGILGMHFPNPIPSFDYAFPGQNVYYVYPTQIYEMLAYFLIFIYLYRYRHKVNFNGELFFEYLFLTGLSRFLIEFIRFHDSNAFELMGLYGAQYVSLVMIIFGTFFHYKFRNTHK